MSVLRVFLENQGVVVLDGGLATELENRGESLDHPLWSANILLSDPAKIASVHGAYFAAGADVAITSSYQATFEGLQATGLGRQEAEQVLRRSVSVALEARQHFWDIAQNRIGRLRPLVAASIGPYGAFLHDGSEYRGDYGIGRAALKEFHRMRFRVLAESGADLLACESIPSLLEADALCGLLAETATIPAWVSFTCKDDAHISDGTPFADAVALVSQTASVVAVGLNCTAPRFVNALLEKARRVTERPLVAYPNSGEIYDSTACAWRSTSDLGTIENAAHGWFERGARLIGGCCRTTPETIRGIRHALTSASPACGGNN